MAYIPYPEDLNHPDIRDLANQIKAERGGRVNNLYRMLLNSPPIASGWLHLLTAIRQQSILSGKYREMTILRIALVNRADFEFTAHVPFALKEGMSQLQIDQVNDWKKSLEFSEVEQAVLAYSDAMTLEVQVSTEIFDRLRPHFNTREITELTATIASYNMVSRFLSALNVDHQEALKLV